VDLLGELQVFLVYLVGVDSKIRIDLVFSFGCDKQDRSLQSSNTRKDEIQQNKREWIKSAIVIEIHPER
jgi:hypothetical protein